MSTFLERLDDYNRYSKENQITKEAEISLGKRNVLVSNDPKEYLDDASVARELYRASSGKLRQAYDDYKFRNGGMSVPFMMAELTSSRYDPSDTEKAYELIGNAANFDYHAGKDGPHSALLANPNMRAIRDRYQNYMKQNKGYGLGASLNWYTGLFQGTANNALRKQFQSTGQVGDDFLMNDTPTSAYYSDSEWEAMHPKTQQEAQEQGATQPQGQQNGFEGIGRYLMPALGAGAPLALLAAMGGKSNWILPLLALLGLGGVGYGYARNQGWQGFQPVEQLANAFSQFTGSGQQQQAQEQPTA